MADDTIRVDSSVFVATGLTAGAVIDAARFVTGTVAGDGGDRFIYDPGTGNLFFDRDGTGGAAQVQFAKLWRALP